MDNITPEAFLAIMSVLVPLAIFMGINEDRFRKEDDSK